MFQLIEVTWEWWVLVTEHNKSTYQYSCLPLTALNIKDYRGLGDNYFDLLLTHSKMQPGGLPYSGSFSKDNSGDSSTSAQPGSG